MKTLQFTKVHENHHQRFYKLSEPVTKAPNDRFIWEIELDIIKGTTKPECLINENGVEYVCVSDATTHVERLAFCAAPYKDIYAIVSFMDMDGKHTFMSYGGDSKDVHSDEVYLRRIASVNGYGMELLTQTQQS